MRDSITAHMIIRNEEQWVWYAIASVLPYVQKIIVYDTGSTDKTVAIVQSLQSNKILFEEKGVVSKDELVMLRNEQLRQTKTNWFLLLDGDEVWTNTGIKEQVKLAQTAPASVIGIVVPVRICVGDIYHVQDEKAGKYQLLGKTGHYNIRVYRKKENYQWIGTYPLEAYCSSQKRPIQNDPQNLTIAKEPYWHLSHLYRSSVDTHRKRAYEIGRKDTASIPSVFHKKRPAIVPAPWVQYRFWEKIIAIVRTPILYVKRRL